MPRPTNPDTFPAQLMHANKEWNAFAEGNLQFIDSYNKARQRVLADWDVGKGIITTETKDLRLKELYEENLPYSRELAEKWLAVKKAEQLYAPYRNRETLHDDPYWANVIDDTLAGGIGHEPTKRKVFYEGSLDGIQRQPDGVADK